jgi:hypothetical protein
MSNIITNEDLFPRTTVGGISVSRMLMGINWLFGYSHRGPAIDTAIRERYQKPEDFFPVFKAYLDGGVDTILGPFSATPLGVDAVKYAEDKLGKKIIIVDTPHINVEDSAEGRREAEKLIKKSHEIGASITLLFHACVEELVDKHRQEIPRVSDYLSMIRDVGNVPGLGAHMPEVVRYADMNEYDVETYIQIFNCLGYLMQVEVPSVAKIIHEAKKPVMTIKPMAAGQCSPYVGFTFTWNAIRDCDMVAVGAGSALEAIQDVEMSKAIIERRHPFIEARNSPVKQAALGN